MRDDLGDLAQLRPLSGARLKSYGLDRLVAVFLTPALKPDVPVSKPPTKAPDYVRDKAGLDRTALVYQAGSFCYLIERQNNVENPDSGFHTDVERRTGCINPLNERPLARANESKLLLKLQSAHRRQRAKVMLKPRDADEDTSARFSMCNGSCNWPGASDGLCRWYVRLNCTTLSVLSSSHITRFSGVHDLGSF